MYRTGFLALTLTVILVSNGCSGSRNASSPLTPNLNQTLSSPALGSTKSPVQTHLWGFYNVYLDLEHKTAVTVLNRQAMFTANVIDFLNHSKNSVQFNINSTPVGKGYIDADIDVVLTHPLPNMPRYNGYDVRGVFIGRGSQSLKFDPALKTASKTSDQILVNADGYTRWYNPSEFTGASPLGYVTGKLVPKGYVGTSTLNAYKYFADGLTAKADLFEWQRDNSSKIGTFTSGSKNSRNYYLHFPFPDPSVNFNYAVVVSWKGELPSDHPAPAPEATACNVVNGSDISLTSPGVKQGNLRLDISLSGWGSQPSTIYIESTVLSNPYKLTSEMSPIDGDNMYSTYHVDLPVDINSTATIDEYWVIAEYDGCDYTNEYGVTNTAGTSKLVSCFRYPLNVKNPNGGWGKVVDATDVTVDSKGNPIICSYGVYKYSPSGDLLWAQMDVSGFKIGVDSSDNIYVGDNYLTKLDPAGNIVWTTHYNIAYLREMAVDPDGNAYEGYYDLNAYSSSGDLKWEKHIGGYGSSQVQSVAFDSGKVYVAIRNSISLDLGDGKPVTSNGSYDAVLAAYDPNGKLLWKRNWGGVNWDESRAVGAANGKVYMTVAFSSPSMDRGDGVKVKTRGWLDILLVCLDSNGKYLWSRQFGGTHDERAISVAVGGTGNISISGKFDSVDFDPGDGSSIPHEGLVGTYVVTYSSTGSFLWAHTWPGIQDYDSGVAADASGNVYTVASLFGNTDLAPSGAPCFEEPDWVNSGNGNGAFLIKHLPDGCW